MFDTNKFKEKIKEKRIANGLTQRELALLLNLSQTTICCSELGYKIKSYGECVHIPECETLYIICKWLEMPMESFFK